MLYPTRGAVCRPRVEGPQYGPEQHKTRKIQTQNTLTLLNYRLDYVFGVDLRIKSGFINVICAFLRSFQHQFTCFVPFK